MRWEEMTEKLSYKSKRYLKKNGATILTVAGAIGLVATTVTAIKTTPKVLNALEEAEAEKGEELTKVEKAKIAVPKYVPTILFGVGSIACMFGANVLNKRHQAALTSAYALLDNSFKDYKKKVNELYGPDADVEVTKELAKDRYEESEIVLKDDNKILFYDGFSERYFESTMEAVLKAEYNINKKIQTHHGVYLNEFYEYVGLEPVPYGDYLGWSIDELYQATWENWLDFRHETVEMEGGLECIIIAFSYNPVSNFEEWC